MSYFHDRTVIHFNNGLTTKKSMVFFLMLFNEKQKNFIIIVIFYKRRISKEKKQIETVFNKVSCLLFMSTNPIKSILYLLRYTDVK